MSSELYREILGDFLLAFGAKMLLRLIHNQRSLGQDKAANSLKAKKKLENKFYVKVGYFREILEIFFITEDYNNYHRISSSSSRGLTVAG
ncbi:hypothetical protein BpHYR1_040044 [Brachionus plicatilis]|uniref:Uncharacterized protein n=1 Tax=Brachionus plicatilis TaxID=10195 RepID=A0A3M7QJY5_BRAPC|nr:hypothetical protein BpHYR1_040044 [Brachionus plicatilis]